MVAQAVIDLGLSRLLLPQFVHRGVREVAPTFQLTVIGEHQAITEYVVRGGEQSAPHFGKPVYTIAQWLAQKADLAPRVAVLFLVRAVRARQPGHLRLAWPEGGFRHSERIEETLLEKLLVGHAADDLDDACGDVHALVAIGVL